MKLLLMMLLCSCGDLSHQAGESAAARMGLDGYVIFMRHGQPDSAALAFYNAHWYIYHPTLGSQGTIFTDFQNPPKIIALLVEGAMGPITLKRCPRDSGEGLLNGCFPRAGEDVRLHGGFVATEPGHAYAVHP